MPTDIAATCGAWSAVEISTQWCWLNELFGDNPALGFVAGLIIPLATWGAQFAIRWYIDSRRWLSGKWLLCIYDSNGDPYKFDLYTLRQRRASLTGKIRRIISLENSEQVARRYGLRGFVKNSHINFSFWPLSKHTPSFGTCTLKLVSDNEYEGFYTRPYERQRDEEPIARISLTRSQSRVKQIISGLKFEQRAMVWKQLFGRFAKMA